MTATGFALMIIGPLFMIIFGTRNPFTHNNADALGAYAFFFGVLLVLAGLVRWLWEVMP